jgi:hypothetical protein
MDTNQATPPAAGEPEHLTRPQTLERLRTKLLTLTDSEHCVCAVADRLGLACGGFSQFTDAQFRQRFAWIADKRPHASRKELEEAVNAYLLGRQEATGAVLACDVETREHDACGGWNTFDNAALEGLYKRVFGRPIRIG